MIRPFKPKTIPILIYAGGLGPGTEKAVEGLNKEAAQRQTGVCFVLMADRVLAIGDLERAARSITWGGWWLRCAIEYGFRQGEESVPRRANSKHKDKLRTIEKNRGFGFEALMPWSGERLSDADQKELIRLARMGETLLSPAEEARLKIKVAAGTLYHLISAVPQAERDSLEIYPGDFLTPLIQKPLQTSLWVPSGFIKMPYGTGSLRDYSERRKLPLRGGGFESGWRQKAASPCWLIPVTAELNKLCVYLWGLLKPPHEQRLLERIGRLYKKSCWHDFADKFGYTPWNTGTAGAVLNDAKKEAKGEVLADNVSNILVVHPEISNREIAKELGVSIAAVRRVRAGDDTIRHRAKRAMPRAMLQKLGPTLVRQLADQPADGKVIVPPSDHTGLLKDQAAHNDLVLRLGGRSYWDYAVNQRFQHYPLSGTTEGGTVGLSKGMRQQGSLNLDVDVEARNNHINNIKSQLRSDHYAEQQTDRIFA